MTKEISSEVIMNIYKTFSRVWREESASMRVGIKSLYNIVALKRKIEEKANEIQDTAFSIVAQNGGTYDENGQIHGTDEQLHAINKALKEFSDQKIKIDYEEIKLKEEDIISPLLLETIYDFVCFE